MTHEAGFDRPITPHFWRSEFACHDAAHTPYPEDWIPDRGYFVAVELEQLRLLIGPFSPTSVYRTWAHHAATYAAMVPPQPPQGSKHLVGLAADVPCPAAWAWARFVAAVLQVAQRPGSRLRYVKFYRAQRFAHLDLRDAPTLTVEYA